MIHNYKNIKNNIYCVTNFGNIYKITDKYKIKLNDTNPPYYMVYLSNNNGKSTKCRVHILVYKYCSGNIDYDENDRKIQIDHIDSNSYNNNLNNLRIVTRSENGYSKHNYVDTVMDGKKILFCCKKTNDQKIETTLHGACRFLNIQNIYNNINEFYEQNKINDFYIISLLPKNTKICIGNNLLCLKEVNLDDFICMGKIMYQKKEIDLSHLYISKDSRIFDTKINKIKRQCLENNNDNYYTYRIKCKNYDGHIRIHRLVAKYFLPNGDKYFYNDTYIVDHIDGNKHNNNVLNLQWITKKENTIKGCGIETIKINNNGIIVEIFKSKEEATKDAIAGTSNTTFDLYRNKENATKAPNGFYYKERNNENIGDVIILKNNRDKKIIKADLKGNILKIYNSNKDAKEDNNLNSLNMSIKFQMENNKNVDKSLYDKNIIKLHGFLWKYWKNEKVNDNIL